MDGWLVCLLIAVTPSAVSFFDFTFLISHFYFYFDILKVADVQSKRTQKNKAKRNNKQSVSAIQTVKNKPNDSVTARQCNARLITAKLNKHYSGLFQ